MYAKGVKRREQMVKIRQFELTCNLCIRNKEPIPNEYDVTGMTDGEIWDMITPMAQQMGWRIDSDPENKNRRFSVCPGCQQIEQSEDKRYGDLAAFSEDSVCPKCNAKDVTTDHSSVMQGLNQMAVYRKPDREWLQRKCQRCNYEWQEACLDNSEPPQEKQ